MKANSNRRQRGTSLVELMVVVSIVGTLSGIAIMNTTRPTTTTHANTATTQVVETLRQARQLAIGKRRNVLVAFNGKNQIATTVETLPGEVVPTPILPVTLNDGAASGLQFHLFNTLPNTPMGPLGFGNGAAIDLEAVNGGNAGTVVMFSPSGAFVGVAGAGPAGYYAVGNSNPINATVYIGISTDTSTARAITVAGATGRIRSFAWDGTAWRE